MKGFSSNDLFVSVDETRKGRRVRSKELSEITQYTRYSLFPKGEVRILRKKLWFQLSQFSSGADILLAHCLASVREDPVATRTQEENRNRSCLWPQKKENVQRHLIPANKINKIKSWAPNRYGHTAHSILLLHFSFPCSQIMDCINADTS